MTAGAVGRSLAGLITDYTLGITSILVILGWINGIVAVQGNVLVLRKK